MIPVTKPFLPPREEYEHYLQGIWQRNWLTNHGPLVSELELKLKEHLGLDHLLFLSNGTIAIQIAIKALDLKGEIITTPYSYVATTSTIAWEGCTSVFVDVNPATLNIDAAKIEQAITQKTSAIVATHVYGNPCDIEAIDAIARKHNLKVIYDAAHAFGVTYKGRSIFEYGDISTASFHATKIFHTVEGGAVITKDPELLKRMAYLRNFGHEGTERFAGIGINGKNSEFHAAMGLVNLKHIAAIFERRKMQWLYYREILKELEVSSITIADDTVFNYSYYPVLFRDEKTLLKSLEILNQELVYPRRYFYPSLNTLPYVQRTPCPVSESASSRVVCLPLYYNLSQEEQRLVARLLLRAQNF